MKKKIGVREEKRMCELAQGITPFSDSEFDDYRDNPNIVKTAMENWRVNNLSEVHDLMSDSLKNDKEFLKDIAKNVNIEIFRYSDVLKADEQYCKDFFNNVGWTYLNDKNKNYSIYNCDIPCLSSDKEITLKAVGHNPTYMNMASEELKDDKEFCLQAINADSPSNTGIIRVGSRSCDTVPLYVSDRLKDDSDFMLQVCKVAKENDRLPWATDYASPRIKELCNGIDPIKALEADLHRELLQSQLSNKNRQQKPKGMKI